MGCVTSVAINTYTDASGTTLAGTVGPGSDFDDTDYPGVVFPAQGLDFNIGYPVGLSSSQVGFSTYLQTGLLQTDSTDQVSLTYPAAMAGGGTMSVDGPTDDQQVIAQPSVGVGKFISIGTNLVMDANGNIYSQGVNVSIGAAWPPSPVSVTLPLNNGIQFNDHNVPLGYFGPDPLFP
jgi:hypothetical protein